MAKPKAAATVYNAPTGAEVRASKPDRRRARRFRTHLLAPLGVLCFSAGAVHADDDQKPPVDKSAYSLLNPTPDKDLRDFNPDRPGKITGPFTIDAGHVEIESDFVNYLHSDVQGVTNRSFEVLDPTLKLGVLSNVDLEMALNGDEFVREVPDKSPQKGRNLNGFGDVYLRAKINVLGNDGGDVALAFVPYVKLPANDPASLALGNGVVESGGFATAQVKLPQDFQLGLQTEVDALKGGNDSQRHANFVNIAALSHAVPGLKNLTATAEFYSSVSTDHYTPTFYTADFALAYLIKPSTQLDLGTNIGLNRDAPDLQLYAGISQRF